VIRKVSLTSGVLVLVASGAYALIYLFRWEWHRAIITALFFVAAEVGLGLVLLLRRLGRLEQRLDALDRARPVAPPLDPEVLVRVQDAAPPARNPFAWLDPKSPNLSVFLPFLLGVGALASGLAWVVEQLARRTTAPALERRLARQLAPLSFPDGGLLGPRLVEPPARDDTGPAAGMLLPLAAVVAAVALLYGGIDWLGDAIQSRPERRAEGVTTRIEVQLHGERSSARPEQTAGALWGTCSTVLRGDVAHAAIAPLGGGRIELLVPADIGPRAQERIRGCLEDAVVDRVQATVVSLGPATAP
jgi:hypothetical protein